ncbi:hypothetical protein H6794_00550 [Candidatus Nomurabacteria bacterium]|nr:hypothetical protein [Candidatus Saccharibacteria bacterium]MCB9839331.1 hypothetical protein [Candidatus Nomurabacteria bacterium]
MNRMATETNQTTKKRILINHEKAPKDDQSQVAAEVQQTANRSKVAGTRIITPPSHSPTEEVAAEQPLEAETGTIINHEPTTGLPDSADKLAHQSEAKMQTPKLFDTKEYHLPISQSTHSHGFLVGSIIFGVLFAIALVGLVVFLYN